MLYIKRLNAMKMKNKTCHTVGRVQTSIIKMTERGRMNKIYTHIHDRSIYWLVTSPSINQAVLQ